MYTIARSLALETPEHWLEESDSNLCEIWGCSLLISLWRTRFSVTYHVFCPAEFCCLCALWFQSLLHPTRVRPSSSSFSACREYSINMSCVATLFPPSSMSEFVCLDLSVVRLSITGISTLVIMYQVSINDGQKMPSGTFKGWKQPVYVYVPCWKKNSL